MKNSFGLESKVPFVIARFGPNFDWLWRMERESHLCLSQSATMRDETGTKNCFCLKIKVPFVPARFGRNIQCLSSKDRGCHMW
jgi:hypothetical protein